MSLSLFKCNNEGLSGKTVLYNMFMHIRSNEMAMKVRWPSPWIGALWFASLTLITGSRVTNYDWPFGTLPFGLF